MTAADPTLSGTGIGLRQPHYREVFERLPELAFLEVHSENFFLDGGASMHALERARAAYPISLHGVGLSLASADALAGEHLAKLKRLIDPHGSLVCDAVWSLYEEACRRFGPKPTLIEWDTDLPALDVLLSEAARAGAIAGHVAEVTHD